MSNDVNTTNANDFVLDKKISVAELVSAVANVFHTAPQSIYVPNYTPEHMFSADSRPALALLITNYDFDTPSYFPFGLGIYANIAEPDTHDIEVIRQLIRVLQCRVLMEPLWPPSERSDDTIFWLVEAHGSIDRVIVEGDPLDNDPPGFVIDPSESMQPIDWPPAA